MGKWTLRTVNRMINIDIDHDVFKICRVYFLGLYYEKWTKT